MPHACTFTRTCPAPGVGISLSTSSSGPPAFATCTARIFAMTQLQVPFRGDLLKRVNARTLPNDPGVEPGTERNERDEDDREHREVEGQPDRARPTLHHELSQRIHEIGELSLIHI